MTPRKREEGNIGATATVETPTVKTPKAPKVKLPATVTIQCIECGASREIPRGEAFQVKRCVECQKKHTKELRKAYRKNKMATLRERIIKLEAILYENKIAVPA